MHITKINQYKIHWSIDIFLHLTFWIYVNISECTLKVNTAFWLKRSLPFPGIRVSCITVSLSICESRWLQGRIKVEKIRKAWRSKIRCLDALSYKSWEQQRHAVLEGWRLSAGKIRLKGQRGTQMAGETNSQPRRSPTEQRPGAPAAVSGGARSGEDLWIWSVARRGSAVGVNEAEQPEAGWKLRTQFLKKPRYKERSQKDGTSRKKEKEERRK